ncbi:HNH endonuclease signature motif containing protein [Streptomyces sp. NPDC004647]|uniref:HNH endonuclease signature motif containing protein n=1 Tax=Streptomyces sp. NPDC004647 TaxID=3154671 RepID=UPI0033B64FFC
MPVSAYPRDVLAKAVAKSSTWADLMRALSVHPTGWRRRVLQRMVVEYGIDTRHFKQQSPWRKYSDEAIARAVASSTTLREVVTKLGAKPATGTLSHIRRRIAAAGIDVSHFPGLNRPQLDLPFTREELAAAAASADSIRSMARILGVPDDGRSRAVLRRMVSELKVDVTHFRHVQLTIPEDQLREAVSHATSYADVMRALGLPVNDVNHRRVQRRTLQLGLDTSRFKRRSRRTTRAAAPKPIAHEVLRVRSEGSPRVNRDRLHRALAEIGVPYHCVRCDNPGTWHGQPITLQIDHINGDWLDNRPENLRYLCPNCHAITSTWCRNRRNKR